MVTGKSLGGTSLYDDTNRLDRDTALYSWTKGSAWFSGEEKVKGNLVPGEYADLTVLSDDFFHVDEEKIKHIQSELTIVGGNIVHGSGTCKTLDPPLSALGSIPELVKNIVKSQLG